MLLLDAPSRVEGRVAYRDHLDPRVQHVLPDAPLLRALRLGEVVELEVSPSSGWMPPEPHRPALLEASQISLVRFEAKPGPERRPSVHVRSLLSASVGPEFGGRVLLRGKLSPGDRSELQRVVSGGASRLALVHRHRFSGLEPPSSLRLRVWAHPARSLLSERFGVAVAHALEPNWWQPLLDGGMLELLEGPPEDPLERALLHRALRALLFEPEPGLDVLGREAIAADPALGFVDKEATQPLEGWRLKSEARLDPAPIELDGRWGLHRFESAVSAVALAGEAATEAASGQVWVGAHPESDWSGVAAIEVECRARSGPSSLHRIDEDTPSVEWGPEGGAELRVRALLANDEATVLAAPEWTAWSPARFGRGLDPQEVAGRRSVRVGYGWLDPSRVRAAELTLEGPNDRLLQRLDNGNPETVLTVVGRASAWKVEFGLSDGADHVEGVLGAEDPSCVVVPSPPRLGEPVLVRLHDPMGRFEQVAVHVGTGPERRRFLLSRWGPEAVWVPSAPGAWRMELEAKLTDGRKQRQPLRSYERSFLVVGDPDIELRGVTLEAGERRLWAVVEAEPPLERSAPIETYVEPRQKVTVELPSRVDSPFGFRLFGEAYDAEGVGERIEPVLSHAPHWTHRTR